MVVSTSQIECGSDPCPRAWSNNRLLVPRRNCTRTLNIFNWAAPQHGPQQRGIDWLAAVHVPDARQAIPTLIARCFSLPKWPLMGGDADRFNPFWTLEIAYNVGVFYCVRRAPGMESAQCRKAVCAVQKGTLYFLIYRDNGRAGVD